MKNIGGQAVIEGVMMKGHSSIATAVRMPDKSIRLNHKDHKSMTEKHRLLNLPIIRGIVSLYEMMVLGLNELNWSANQQLKEEEKLSDAGMTFTVVLSIIMGLGLFVGLPYVLTRFITEKHDLMFNIIDGVFRFLIFIVYLLSISLIKDVKRLFQYHGAEHKAVNCHEAGLELNVENVQKFKTVHPRCGTSLIVFVLGVSIVLFSLIKSDLWYVNVLMRIIAIPLVAGISYEALKFGAKFYRNIFVRAFIQPGLWVQKITTQEPDDAQVEVAIEALKAVKSKSEI